ncbi:MAG: SDR family oxidoreductase [bacterium]
MRFEGKRALITGGSRGIGKAIALLLAREGCHIAINYMRNRKTAEETQQEILQMGVECLLLEKNIYKWKNVKELFAELRKHWDYLDYFVSNAALGTLRPVISLPEAGWDLAMDVNAKAFLAGFQEAVRMMEGRKGKIGAISSIGSHFHLPGYAGIGASKAAIETLVRYMAKEAAEKNIWVNAVSGGPVETDSLRSFPNYEFMQKYTIEHTPFHRMGRPEDIARVAVWLLSDESDWVTGQVIVADGGLTLG